MAIRKYQDTPEFNPHRKKPDYYYAFLGDFIMYEWRRHNGLHRLHTKILIILSYYDYILLKDVKYWHIKNEYFHKYTDELIAMGYVIKTKTFTRSLIARKYIYALTQKGRDFERDFERFYDAKFTEFAQKKFGIPSHILLRDGAPFRRVRKTKEEMRNDLERQTRPDTKNSQPSPFKGGVYVRYKDIDYE